VLRAIVDYYHSKKEEISEYTQSLVKLITPKTGLQGEINESIINDAVTRILFQFDPQNGGFGTAPKFPMPGAIEFLMNRYVLSGNEFV